ncbi:hypothetical protein DWZ04_02375 [Faecalibacterium prausnitzii]|uniref:Uncharacterized protein n=1 Tax=Faecalibacterium prausnitzii TaxID=853 RepID=A0A3E2UUK6_9FIRM|nr:hypothetical protein C4Q21_07700 [Faecalibacterium prausnitzii]RGC00759.1 hypothetical protein DWZ04_02375 [Faecalibacterium prausnitzii]
MRWLFLCRTISNGLRCALAIFSGIMIYYFGITERLRMLRHPIFTGEDVRGYSSRFQLRPLL